MAESNFLIAGASGTGKSTVGEVLRRNGHRAIDADEAFGRYVVPGTSTPTGDECPQHWFWHTGNLLRELRSTNEPILFLCGGAMNQDDFLSLFTTVFVLYADPETLASRLTARGLSAADVSALIASNDQERHDAVVRGHVLVDASRPVEEVVLQILAHAGGGQR